MAWLRCWLFALCACSSVAWANEGIHLKDIFHKARYYYPSQQSASQNINIANHAVKVARAGYYPTLDINLDYVDSDNDDVDYREAKVSVAQPLYNRATGLQVEASNIGVAISQLQVLEGQQALLVEIADVFTNMLIQEEQVVLALQSVREAETLKNIAKKAFELQTRSELDYLRANAALAEAKVALVEAENAAKQLRAQLMLYLPAALPSDQNFTPFQYSDFASASFLRIQEAAPECKSCSEEGDMYQTLSAFENPSLQRIALEREQQKAQLKTAYAAYYPTITLRAEATKRYALNVVTDREEENDEWKGVLSFNWNLFRGFLDKNNARSEAIRLDQKGFDAKTQRTEINQNITQTRTTIQSSKVKQMALRDVLRAREQSLKTAEKSWQLNLVDISEVHAEQKALQETKLELYREARTQDLEQLRLVYLLGGLNIYY